MPPSLSTLAAHAEKEFEFLRKAGLDTVERHVAGESSYRGGFDLIFRRRDTMCKVEYGDCEFSVVWNGEYVFGADSHPGFSGNMFSREHLDEHLPALAAAVRDALSECLQNEA
jgi:hypothetical protein